MSLGQILEPGQKVQAGAAGIACEVQECLGGGNQGEVYRATLAGKPVALKWYFPAAATPVQRAALEALVKTGPPNERFLWPLELVASPDVDGFGLVMPLREARYKGIVDLV